MGNVDSKYRKEEDSLRIDDLPVEVLVKIISYLNSTKKIKIFSLVNKRWFAIANNEIEALSIKWPQEKNQFSFWKFWKFDSGDIQDIKNLIVRFSRLKNLELASKITNKDMILPLGSFLDSFGFDGTMEFDVSLDLIQTKINPDFEYNYLTTVVHFFISH
jgi:hypothetical protein